MKSTLALILPAMAVFSSTAMSASLFQLDFNHRSSANYKFQAGWEQFNPTSDATASGTANYSGYEELAGVGNNLVITTTNMTFARTGPQSDAAAVVDIPGTNLDNMYHDLIFRNNADAAPTVTISNLLAGTYTITTHHMITDAGTDKTFFDYAVQDADSAAFGQNVGNFKMGNLTDGVTVVSYNVVSDGVNPISFRLTANPLGPGGTGNWFGINGLQIVPEPSTALLGGLGLLALLRRRR